jgi:hypothetical protein
VLGLATSHDPQHDLYYTTVVMFSSYPHYTATYQNQATLPPLQQTTYLINNTYNLGAPVQPTVMEVSAHCDRLMDNDQIKVKGSHAGERLPI